MSYKKILIGDTVRFTWINSGVGAAPIMGVYTGSETLIDSGTMTDSGNGHYYFNHTVNSAGYFNMVSVWSLSGNPYKNNLQIKGVTGGVD